MLSLSRVSARQGQTYYAQENYYTRNNTVENSEWQGLGAAEFGLTGSVRASVFQELLEGRKPGTELKLNSSHDNSTLGRRAGIDLTFSAPKSVSLAALVGGDARLEEAHREAVTAALNVAEQRYSITRVGSKNTRSDEVAGNFIAAKFHHDTSRAKDPQLHTHCVVINAVHRADGEWRSLHNDALFRNSKLLGLIYQNELAQMVANLGFEIGVKNNGTFEITGYSQEQLQSFSKRREQLEEMGIQSQKEARQAVKINRPSKGKEIPRSQLLERWKIEANTIGLQHQIPTQKLTEEALVERRLLAKVVQESASHASEKTVNFRREQLESFALETQLGKVDWHALQKDIAAAERKGELIPIEGQNLTTEVALGREKKMLNFFEAGKNKFEPILKDAEQQITQKHPELGKCQTEAIALTLQSRDQFLAWQGVAGAGKTYAMNVLRELSTTAEIPIRGLAPSAEAAKVLEQESHIPSQTVAACLNTSLMQTRYRKGEIWVVDEAGLLSAKDCARLMERAHIAEARVVFVGDTRQLSAVEAGNPFRLLQQKGIATAELNESRRQKNEKLKASVDLLTQGKEKQALEAIAGQIIELKRENSRAKYMAKEYLKIEPDLRDKTLILAGTNRERSLITEEIRTRLKTEKALGDGLLAVTLKAKDMSNDERSHASKFTAGDQLVFHRELKTLSIARNSQWEVVGIKEGALTLRNPAGAEVQMHPQKHANTFQVYHKENLEICPGDKLKWTRNDKTLGVRNGEDCSVVSVAGNNVELQKRDGKRVTLDLSVPLHLDHNYVHTVFSSQGKTCDKVLISVDHTFGKESMYVALSRARYEAKIITPNKEDMFEAISQSRAKVSAMELVPDQKVLQSIGEQVVTQNQRQKLR